MDALLVSPAESPEALDQPVTLIAAQSGDGGSLGAGGASDSVASSWGESSIPDTTRMIGTTGGTVRIVSGVVRLSQ